MTARPWRLTATARRGARGGQQHKAVIGWALNGVYRLHRMQPVTSLDEAVVPSSLSFVNGVVTWTTVSGAAGSARVR